MLYRQSTVTPSKQSSFAQEQNDPQCGRTIVFWRAFREAATYCYAKARSPGRCLYPRLRASASCVMWPRQTFRPARRRASPRTACVQPLSAIAVACPMVALFSASVEVHATAPGMLAMQ